MTSKKPEPIFESRKPKICPVCGKASYSAAGVHPQCSVKQADDRFAAAQKQSEAKSSSDKKAGGEKQLSRWQKSCPKCKQPQHVRKKICDCGHTFAKSISKHD